MSDYDVAEISDALRDSGLSRDELTLIYRLDVAPVVHSNLLCAVGEWAYFDRTWLFTEIIRRRSRCRRSRIVREGLLFVTRFWWTRRRRFLATDALWNRCLVASGKAAD